MKRLLIVTSICFGFGAFSQTTEFSNKNIEIKIDSYYQNDSTIINQFEVKNISKKYIYLPKGGFTSLVAFPLNNDVLLDLTDSKMGKGNANYFQSYVNLDILEPNKTIYFKVIYKTIFEKNKTIQFIYEYLVVNKKLENNRMIAYNYIKWVDKIKLKYTLSNNAKN